MNRLDSRRTGILLAAVTAVTSGVAVFVNGYGVRSWSEVSDATTYTTLKNLVAATVLLGVAGFATRRRSTEGLSKPSTTRQWMGLSVVAIIGGSIPFVLFFEGLARASSVQAAFIHKTLIVWVALLAVRLLREKIGPLHLAAIALLVWGQAALLGGLSGLGFGVGELMILGATLLWSVEVIVAKRLLGDLSSLTVGVARMAGGAALLVGYGLLRGAFVDLTGLGGEQVLWVLVTGAILSVYVGTWFAALARAQVVDVTAVLVGGAVITALLRYGVQSMALPSLGGLGLVALGVAVAVGAGVSRRTVVQSQ